MMPKSPYFSQYYNSYYRPSSRFYTPTNYNLNRNTTNYSPLNQQRTNNYNCTKNNEQRISNYNNGYNHSTNIIKNQIDEKKYSSDSKDFFEIMGLKLYFDDILLISLIFFLFNEGVEDQWLYICLILLLLS